MGRPRTNNSARDDFKVTHSHNETIRRLMRDFEKYSKKLEFFFNAPLIYDVRVRVSPELFTPLREKRINYFDRQVYQVIFDCETAGLDYRQIKHLLDGIIKVLTNKRKSVSAVKSSKFKRQYEQDERDSVFEASEAF